MTLADIEVAVLAATRAAVGDAALATSALIAAIRDRSERYTSDRARLAASPRGDLAARAAFFTIADAPKIAIPLRELIARDALPAASPLRVVDLGAGCGAMSLGLAQTVERPLSITAIDRDRDALGIAAAALRALVPAAEVTTRVDDATSVRIPTCDLVVMGTLLNELAPDAARGVVERALAAISDDGAVIIIEPALRDTTRGLHVLRDALIARGAHVFAPCTRQGAPCPALAVETDWCHEHRRVTLPPRTAELARLTHLRDDGLKFSYLVLRKQPRTLADDPAAWRVVGSPWAQKGKLEVLACSDAGRVPLRRLKRHRAASNRALDDAERGDIVVTDAPRDGDRVDITDASTLTITRPATTDR